MDGPYAHSDPGSPNDTRTWEPLFSEDCEALKGAGHDCEKCKCLDPQHGHLNKVAWWAAKFAAEMFPPGSEEAKAAREWGYLAGLWHDLGKFAPEWQEYLKSKCDPHMDEVAGKIDHATAGAQQAVKNGGILGHLLAYAISGHHSGLLDGMSEFASLEKRLAKKVFGYLTAPQEILNLGLPPLPPSIAKHLEVPKNRNPFSLGFFGRMLFSCLVDADFLATEAFMAPKKSSIRPRTTEEILKKMTQLVEQHVSSFGSPKNPVAEARRSVYENCQSAATQEPGIFTLSVPTGGGKTLSSLAFALRHALRHGHQRIIYVIPFTSIIEQNATVFRNALQPLIESSDETIVLEHHSNLSPEDESERDRLATENWDAPLVVTTAVQFYESLFAARTSRCRKLHNIANAVVILDEAQCLPVDFLRPCLDSLRELSRSYGTTSVLCTATQPAIQRSSQFPIGLDQVREIVPNPSTLYQSLKRVEMIDRGEMSDQQIAGEIEELPQVLVIVNTRNHAQSLFQRLPDSQGNFHLSALMCPEHRQDVLASIRQRLDEGQPVRLISTQLIEAGVDVDFPTVYRSLAGIDSIAQAAGRCNRNGKLPLGTTYVFRSEHVCAEAYFRDTAQIADQVLALVTDPLGLESVERFFSLYYLQHQPPKGKPWDTKTIHEEFRLAQNRDLPFQFQFAEVAKEFRLIENLQVPILIPFDEKAKELMSDLRNGSIPLHRDLLRGLQRYTVQIPKRLFEENCVQFEVIRDGQFHVLICPETHYSPNFGLNLNPELTPSLIC